MSSAKTAPRARSHKRLLALIAAGLGIALLAAALIARDEILFNARLLNAKFIADDFYANSRSITKNVGYGPGSNEKLDVYVPDAPGPHPVLIWVYGGSWNSGNKELYAPVAQRLVPNNIIVVIPNYTLFSTTDRRVRNTPIGFQQAREVADALAWTRKNISLYGGNPDQIIWGGQSAGAQLTGLVTFDPQYLEKLGTSAHTLCGWYGIAGPYDLNAQVAYEKNVKGNDAALLHAVFGNTETLTAASPQAHIRADVPRTLLIHGDADETVPLSISQNFANALRAAGVNTEFKIYPGAGHSGLLFDALAQEKPRLVQDLVDFISQCK